MKKLLLLTVLILVSVSGFAQELTADSVAVQPSILEQALQIILAGLGVLIGLVIRNGLPLLKSYMKAHMHFRGAEIVQEAVIQAIEEMGAEMQKALADGVVTAEEKAALKARAKEIAADRLKNLSGFYKKDLLAWIDDRLTVELAKLLALI